MLALSGKFKCVINDCFHGTEKRLFVCFEWLLYSAA